MCLEWKGRLFQKQQSSGHLKEKDSEDGQKTTWRKTVQSELNTLNYTWGTSRGKHVTNLRNYEWSNFVTALTADGALDSK